MGMRWTLSWTLPLVALVSSAAPSTPAVAPSAQAAPGAPAQEAPAPSAPEAPQPVALDYQTPGCDPAKEQQCLCVGSVGTAAAALREVGIDARTVRTSGVPCIRGDFDRDGEPDYAFPGAGFSCNGSVPVRILFTRGGLVREVQKLPREVSCLQLYRPHKKRGLHGVPATDRDALVDWGEGNATWFYAYDGKSWKATRHLSESN